MIEAQEPSEDDAKTRIGLLFDFAISEAGREFRVEAYRVLSAEEADKVQKLIAEAVEKYEHVLDTHAIRHTIKQHSGEREYLRGQLPITRDDFLLLPDVVSDPNALEYADKTKQGRHVVVYEKIINDVVFFVKKEVRTGRGQLALVTFYKRRRSV